MEKVLVIVGPTGVGKTGLALELASKNNGELISADSRQVYKGLDVGTGKEVELLVKSKSQGLTLSRVAEKHDGYWLIKGIKVNLYDFCRPGERFTAAGFKKRAETFIEKIHKEGKLPIVVGGTGLYVSALVENYQFPGDSPDSPLRKRLSGLNTEELINELVKVAPDSLETVDVNNPARLRRALEVFYTSGTPIGEKQKKAGPAYDFLVIGLTRTRAALYHHVDMQVDDWLQRGLIEETGTALKNYPKATILQGIHYKQVVAYLHNQISKAEMTQRIKFERHAYIRRQYTWFNKMKNLTWFDVDHDQDKLIARVETWLHN